MRYTQVEDRDRPTIPAAPAAKRMQSGIRRAVRDPVDALLVEYLDDELEPDTIPRPAVALAMVERMTEK